MYRRSLQRKVENTRDGKEKKGKSRKGKEKGICLARKNELILRVLRRRNMKMKKRAK
jgi:hypothetical protein